MHSSGMVMLWLSMYLTLEDVSLDVLYRHCSSLCLYKAFSARRPGPVEDSCGAEMVSRSPDSLVMASPERVRLASFIDRQA